MSTLQAEREYRIELSHEAALPQVLGFLVSAGVTVVSGRTARMDEMTIAAIAKDPAIIG